ncbi:MAG: MBL fold metallo-hydrolase, partial [Polyangiaceae bacterium]
MRHASFFGHAGLHDVDDRARRGARRSAFARLPAAAGAASLAAALLACSEEPAVDGDGAAGPGATSSSSGAGSGAAGGEGGAPSSSSAGAGGSGGGGAPSGGGAPTGGFPDHWIDGTDCGSEPEVMVWQYAEDTFILRQSLCTNFEGPFIYLLFGEDRALVQDSGTGDADLAGAVQTVVDAWLAAHGKTSIELVVTHSHSHGDHVGGDAELGSLPDAAVVGLSAGAVQAFFGIDAWPTQIVEYDLGGRVLDVIPIPGHQSAHIALHDRAHDLLLTGDTLYPGRLYIDDWDDYRQSVARLQDFVGGGNAVTWVLGTHIEMSTT